MAGNYTLFFTPLFMSSSTLAKGSRQHELSCLLKHLLGVIVDHPGTPESLDKQQLDLSKITK